MFILAAAESFFATLECELLDRRRFKAQAEARIAVFEFIEGFYNPHRRHSSLGYLSPIKFESQFAETSLGPGAHERASRPSRSGLEISQQAAPPACRPSLTAARHDSLGYVQAGTKRCSRPNQKIAQKRRTECSQIRYPDPKTSPLHEIGASPSVLFRHPTNANTVRSPGSAGADQAPEGWKGKSFCFQAAIVSAPSKTTPAVTYFQKAISSFRAKATISTFRTRPPLSCTR